MSTMMQQQYCTLHDEKTTSLISCVPVEQVAWWLCLTTGKFQHCSTFSSSNLSKRYSMRYYCNFYYKASRAAYSLYALIPTIYVANTTFASAFTSTTTTTTTAVSRTSIDSKQQQQPWSRLIRTTSSDSSQCHRRSVSKVMVTNVDHDEWRRNTTGSSTITTADEVATAIDDNGTTNNDTTTTREGDNKAMAFLRKMGKVGGNKDFRFGVGADEGPSGKTMNGRVSTNFFLKYCAKPGHSQLKFTACCYCKNLFQQL